jgi:hypothetical protein
MKSEILFRQTIVILLVLLGGFTYSRLHQLHLQNTAQIHVLICQTNQLSALSARCEQLEQNADAAAVLSSNSVAKFRDVVAQLYAANARERQWALLCTNMRAKFNEQRLSLLKIGVLCGVREAMRNPQQGTELSITHGLFAAQLETKNLMDP